MAMTYSDVLNVSSSIDFDELIIVLNKNIERDNQLIKKVFPSEEGYPLISVINRIEVEGNLLGSDNYGQDKVRLTVWGKNVNGEDVVGDTYTVKPEDFPEEY